MKILEKHGISDPTTFVNFINNELTESVKNELIDGLCEINKDEVVEILTEIIKNDNGIVEGELSETSKYFILNEKIKNYILN
jgi:hypothetical protein